MSGIALKMAEDMLAKIDKEIADKTGDLGEKRNALAAEIKKLTRGSGSPGGGADAVPNEKIVEAVKILTADDTVAVSSPEIAAHLGVDVRKIARKLAKMGSDGDFITGDKESGYSLA